MAPVRLAVIGAGAIGRKHVELVGREPLCEAVAIVDPSPAAKTFAAEQGVPHFADLAAMLDGVKPDGAIVAAPNALHTPIGLACIERGVPVLIEKPIADSVAAGIVLVEAAAQARVPLLVGHHRRHNPIVQKAREIVQSGKLGRLVATACTWLVKKPDDYFDLAWRREKGGGTVLINLIHDIDDLRFICGEIASVAAFTANETRGFAVEDTAVVALRFSNGALGTVTVSDAAVAPWNWEIASGENPFFFHTPENCYHLTGSEGALTLPGLELWRYPGKRGWDASLSREKIAIVPADPLVEQLRHFVRVVRREESPRVTGADALRTLTITMAVLEAAETGRRIVP